jgi:hypothetical protein
MKPAEPFTLEQLQAATAEVVAEHPRKKNRTPRHFNERGKPVCVVGHVLHHLGVERDDTRIPDRSYFAESAFDLRTIKIIDPDAYPWLEQLQDLADRSATGKARERRTWKQTLEEVSASS